MMKISSLLIGATLALPLTVPVTTSSVQAMPPLHQTARPFTTVKGEAFFLERLMLAPSAKLYVTLVGRVAGAEYLPLATAAIPARSGATPFQFKIAASAVPPGPYRIQAWIVDDRRVLFQGTLPQTVVNSLDEIVKIRLSPVAPPRNIDGIGDGKPLPTQPLPTQSSRPVPLPRPVSNSEYKLSGVVTKLDRRALLPDAKIVVELRDVSLMDAASKLIGTSEIELGGKQLPASYDMTLVGFDLNPRGRYAVSAKVYEGGKLSYITTSNFAFDGSRREQKVNVRVVTAR